jgi:glycosyltransferase involved in cell wall biosynthesis
MNILYLHQYFCTRGGYSGTRSYEFAKYLVNQGHRVTMICSGIATEGHLTVPPDQEYFEVDVDGIHVVPIAAGYGSGIKGTGLGGSTRVRHFMDFARLAELVGRRLPRPDIVFATHTPLFIGLPGMELSRHFGVPFVFEVRDLWPTALVNFGALKNPLAIAWMRRVERTIYHAADHIVALSPGMKAGVCSAGIPDERVTVITNASDTDLFRPDIDPAWGRQHLGLGDRFAAIYFGAMGFANGLDYVVEAAKILRQRGRKDLAFVLHGGGGLKEELQRSVEKEGLDNVIFSELLPDKSQVAQLVAGCNAGMTIYRAAKEHTWSPNKMFDSLAAGRPVLINVPGWLSETVEDNGAGIGTEAENPASLADAMEKLAADPELCKQMGANARALAEREFDRTILAQRLERVLSSTLEKARLRASA